MIAPHAGNQKPVLWERVETHVNVLELAELSCSRQEETLQSLIKREPFDCDPCEGDTHNRAV
jgi:hypothetical protein